MRHYYWHDKTGAICSTVSGTLPVGCDIADPANTHPVAADIRSHHEAHPDFAGWVTYDCECSPEVGHCECAHLNRVLVRVDNGKLVVKPELTVLLDGVVHSGSNASEPVNRKPGSKSVVVLQGDIPDGHKVALRSSKHVHIIESLLTLTFNGGRTEPVTITAPAQGMVGWIYGQSGYLKPFGVHIRGWAE